MNTTESRAEFHHDQCYLKSRGYECTVSVRATYRGSFCLGKIVTAARNGQTGIVHLPSEEEAKCLLKIQKIQTAIPLAAQIIDVIEGRIFVMEYVPGRLLWELEDNLPALSEIENALGSFVLSLKRVNLVHGDIRPWNIYYDAGQNRFRFIDWGFGFFVADGPTGRTPGHLNTRGHKSPFVDVDRIDAERTMQVIRGQISYEDAWFHKSTDMTWKPKWAKID